jgi:hypothetical protein
MKFYGEINYTIDEEHPDVKYVTGGFSPDKRMSYKDEYKFDNDRYGDLPFEEFEKYIKRDLLLVAGGGYNSDHVHNAEFNIYQM